MTVKPISPSEVTQLFPDDVIEAWNEIIQECYCDLSKSSTVKQDDIINKLMNDKAYFKDEIFNKGYLNIEKVYTEAGWTVKYEKPDRDESFKAYFKFTKPRNNQGHSNESFTTYCNPFAVRFMCQRS